jgi:hypothetical protein
MEKLQTVLIEQMSTQERAEELAWFMSSATPVGSLWLSVVPFGYNGKVPYDQLSSQQRFEIDRMTLRLNKAELQHALSERLRLPVVDGYTCPMAANPHRGRFSGRVPAQIRSRSLAAAQHRNQTAHCVS